MGLLEDEFEKETGIRVRHVGAGTGAALELAKKGNVDLVMAHAKSLEEKFVQEGFGTERIALVLRQLQGVKGETGKELKDLSRRK